MEENKSDGACTPSFSSAELEGFEAWWREHGRYCRAGGGDYEKTFAFRAWEAATSAERERICAASMALTDPELRAGVELQRKEIDRLKQQLRDEGDRIAELKRAIEAMRVAGGSVEFQMAFDTAKALIVTPNAEVKGRR